ncbi:MAG: hypothetical protein CVV44_07375 [Spirochaetae bacterium HGW-Spirochaetae-1]|jgi:outer membrane protein assembly factor BamB|nr:MAG: hypothetical protein CVV44_07375 [Spirochaetae bacterium HGW-Spirochaetae-1]
MDINHQTFNSGEFFLQFDMDKSILLCKIRHDSKDKILWAKKLNDIYCLLDILEDRDRFYVACEINDLDGKFIALDKSTGTTAWFIPGRPYFQTQFDQSLFIIFIDASHAYYLLRVDSEKGAALWHHRIEEDLCEYSFNSSRILLQYRSGRTEKLNPLSGKMIF